MPMAITPTKAWIGTAARKPMACWCFLCTAVLGGAWFQTGGRKNWMGSAGLRTGISGIAAKLDFGMQSGGGKAVRKGGMTSSFAPALSGEELAGLENVVVLAAGTDVDCGG